MKRTVLSVLLLGAMLVSLCACAAQPTPDTPPTEPPTSGETIEPKGDISVQIKREPVTLGVVTAEQNAAVAEFALRLVQSTYNKNENNILSPESILTALTLVANGAQGETLRQLESIFGMSLDEMNNLFATRDMGEEFSSANAVWFREGFPVQAEFLQKNADYLGASTYQSAFTQQTVNEINAWVKEHTKNRIERLIDNLSPDAKLVLVNALTFDAKWQSPYTEKDVLHGVFYGADGAQEVSMLSSREHSYLNDGKAVGFIKNYEGGRYAFAALMPNENVSMQEYLAGLTGETLLATLKNAQNCSVIAKIPKLKTECSFESLREALEGMGVTDLFSRDAADLSGVSEEDALYVSSIVHKTFLQIDEEGTKAAAATGNTMNSITSVEPEPKVVTLDRPYLLLIYDRESDSILFCGVINRVE